MKVCCIAFLCVWEGVRWQNVTRGLSLSLVSPCEDDRHAHPMERVEPLVLLAPTAQTGRCYEHRTQLFHPFPKPGFGL